MQILTPGKEGKTASGAEGYRWELVEPHCVAGVFLLVVKKQEGSYTGYKKDKPFNYSESI